MRAHAQEHSEELTLSVKNSDMERYNWSVLCPQRLYVLKVSLTCKWHDLATFKWLVPYVLLNAHLDLRVKKSIEEQEKNSYTVNIR